MASDTPASIQQQSSSFERADSPERNEQKNSAPASPSQREETKTTQIKYEEPAPVENRLRPAADVLNRIVWDPSFDSNDYLIGYEDRFEGRLEASLGSWKKDLTDEEFIPQHRILYIKHKSDGEIVWDRRRRIDKIFNSGNSAFDYLAFLE